MCTLARSGARAGVTRKTGPKPRNEVRTVAFVTEPQPVA